MKRDEKTVKEMRILAWALHQCLRIQSAKPKRITHRSCDAMPAPQSPGPGESKAKLQVGGSKKDAHTIVKECVLDITRTMTEPNRESLQDSWDELN